MNSVIDRAYKEYIKEVATFAGNLQAIVKSRGYTEENFVEEVDIDNKELLRNIWVGIKLPTVDEFYTIVQRLQIWGCGEADCKELIGSLFFDLTINGLMTSIVIAANNVDERTAEWWLDTLKILCTR